MIEWFLWGMICGMWGYVFRAMQMHGGLFNWYGQILDRLPEWIASPLGACEMCHAGQVALWGSFFAFIPGLYSPFCFPMEWNVVGHFAAVVAAMCMAKLLTRYDEN